MLANFNLHEIAAQSAESVVFAGEEKETGAPLAMRRYLARHDGERRAEDAAAFETAVAKVQGIEEDHVVGILAGGFDAQDHHPYFLTRLVEGEALTKMLNGSLLAESDARQVVSEALEGLQFLQDRGLVHGGLRADRLIWSRARGVCLIDAGMEPALITLGDYTKVGEAATSAPEYKQSPLRTTAGDFFALGSCVYELLSGSPLPTDGRPRESVGEGTLARWDGWLDAMCAEDPGARPSSTAEAMQRLDAALSAKVSLVVPAAAAPARGAARGAPMLVRAAPQAPAVLAVANPPAAATAGHLPAGVVTITGQAPVASAAALTTKRRVVTPMRAAATLLGLGGAAGAVFLVLQTHPEDPANPPAAGAPPAAATAGGNPKPAADPPSLPKAAPVERAGAAEYFVKDAKDVAALRGRPDGEPAYIHGQIAQVMISASGKYLDIVFRGIGARACMKIDHASKDQATLRQLQDRFLKKKVKIFGTVEHRAAEEGDPDIGVRFLSAADITIEG